MSHLRRWNELYRDVEARVEADLENIPAYLQALAILTEKQARASGRPEYIRKNLQSASRIIRRAYDDLMAYIGPA